MIRKIGKPIGDPDGEYKIHDRAREGQRYRQRAQGWPVVRQPRFNGRCDDIKVNAFALFQLIKYG